MRRSTIHISRAEPLVPTNIETKASYGSTIPPVFVPPPAEIGYDDSPNLAEGQTAGLATYWRMLVKRRRLAATVFTIVLILGLLWTFTKTPLYSAYALLKIEPQTTAILRVENRVQEATADAVLYDYYKTQFALLQSRPLAANVIQDLKLQSHPSFTEDDRPGLLSRLEAWFRPKTARAGLSQETAAVAPNEFTFHVAPPMINRYLSLLQIKPVNGTRLVQVGFTTPDPRLSQRLANAHAAGFIRNTLASRFELTKEARDFLSQKLAELRGQVEQADAALNQFRKQEKVTSFEGNENIEIERLTELNRRLTDARAKRIEVESLYRMIVSQDPQSLSLVTTSGVIQQIKTTLGTLEAERARLSATFTTVHPRVIELETQINQLRRRLTQETATLVRTIESDLVAARGKEEILGSEVFRQQQAALALKEKEAGYRFLKEETDSSRALYETILKRLHETSVWNESAVSNIEISEPADIPLSPSFPQRQRDISLIVVAGLLLASGLVFGLEQLASTVRTPDDVWRAASTRTLGIVPEHRALLPQVERERQLSAGIFRWVWPARLTTLESPEPQATVIEHSHSQLVEFYRNISAALLFAQEGDPPRVVLVTSAHQGDGKTVSTVNLAITLAESGYTSVVVDGDLRRGRCHSLLRQPNPIGLSDVLSGLVSLEDSLQTTRVPGLSLLSRGRPVPNSVRLLSSRRMKQTTEQLRGLFDFVLIDSPPAIAMSDAAILSQVSDGVLLVMRGAQTPRAAARRVVDRLESLNSTVLGVILNGVDLDDPDFADYQRYYAAVEPQANGSDLGWSA